MGNETNNRPLVILTGPTAVGKTELSIRLAKTINGEIISADALQVYRGMDIGTAKVTREEMDGVNHYLIDVIEPEDEFSVAVFKEMAESAIKEIYQKGKVPIITGGTGFYIQAVLFGIDFDSDDDNNQEYRRKLQQLVNDKGKEYVHFLLKEKDPESAMSIHPNNTQRVIRALEYYYTTGKKFSSHNKEQREKTSSYNYLYFVLNDDRDKLYDRIDSRVEIMFDKGLLAEMQKLIDRGLTRENQSMQAIGYRELFDFFENKTSLEEVKELIKQNSRHYAKRQLTWFRREKEVSWINYPEFNYSKDEILKYMTDKIKEKGII